MIENFGGFDDDEHTEVDINLLDHYFASVYNKLEADALLFNRKLPHHGVAGAENENALGALLRDFLPPRFGVEVSGIVIDRHGHSSRQCDIVIFDAWGIPSYFRKVFPVELVYATIEVKTTLTSEESKRSRENLFSVASLDFRPRLTTFWKTQARAQRLRTTPPLGVVFAFRSDVTAFETFSSWFPFETVVAGKELLSTANEATPQTDELYDRLVEPRPSGGGHEVPTDII
jgi:hypothetical protein